MNLEASELKEKVREKYSNIAKSSGNCCCGGSCSNAEVAQGIGYSQREIQKAPSGSNMGLGCGNPVALSSISRGDVVIDLGCGGGFDCFLSAEAVGPQGRVIGVDMTDEMIQKARKNAMEIDCQNVEFRKGEIENLPIEDSTAHKLISNCVINLSTDKPRCFREAWRVLKSGGEIFISDIVLSKPLPPEMKDSIESYVGCIAGASLYEDYLDMIKKAGFKEITVLKDELFPTGGNSSGGSCCGEGLVLDQVRSITVHGKKL